MDEFDKAQEISDFFLKLDLERHRSHQEIPEGIGVCLNCGEAVEGVARWCDSFCREDWEREQRRKNGNSR